MRRRARRNPLAGLWLRGVAVGLGALVPGALVSPAAGQLEQPAFVDDAPIARDTLRGLGDLIARGGRAEAARALQRLLDEHGSRVVATDADADLFVSVRAAVHERLLEDPELLATYAEVFEPRAATLLSDGDARAVEAGLLLTPSGFEAALRVAQEHVESARFDAAWSTLVQLDRHPSRVGASARAAVRVAGLAASYLGGSVGVPIGASGGEVDALVERWAREAGVAAPDTDRVLPPPATLVRPTRPLEGGPAVDLVGVVARPLAVASFGAESGVDSEGLRERRSSARLPTPRAFPMLVGDSVYASDGTRVWSWDRFTLRPSWVASPRAASATGIDSQGSQTRSHILGFAGNLIIAVTSPNREDGRPTYAPAVHAIDRASGRVVWSGDPSSADERLRGAVIVGPAVVAGDTVVVSLRKSVRSRRLISTWMVGLSLDDGEPRWVSLVSSAGSLPYQQGTGGVDAALARGGLVYRADDIGVVAAVEAATGRPVWLRRLAGRDGRSVRRRGEVPAPDAPVLVDGVLFVLSGDGRRVLTFDAATGDPGPVGGLEGLGPFDRLLMVGDRLCVFAWERALFLEPAGLESGPVTRLEFDGSRRAPAGVPTVAGESLLVPVSAGVLLFDPERGAEQIIELDVPGNAVAADGQLLVAFDGGLSSYLAWEAAAGVLSARIEASPADPSPATTFAELAYSSGRFDRIVDVADRAIAAIEGMSDPVAREGARSRLFSSLREMVEASQRRWAEPADNAPGAPVITDAGLLREILDRVSMLARVPDERVAALLARGRFAEAAGRPGEALEAYQAVLADRDLSAANWRGSGLSVRAELEASRRLDGLVLAGPPGLYEPFDAEARVRLDALMLGDANAAAIEAIARAYPVSVVAVEAWRSAALAHVSAGRAHDAVRAGRAALDAADRLRTLGRPLDVADVSDAGTWLLSQLLAAGRLDEASLLVDRVARSFPKAELQPPAIDGRTPSDVNALLVELRAQLAEAERAPSIGSAPSATVRPQLFGGHLLVPIQSVTGTGEDIGRSWADGVLVMNNGSGELSFLVPDEDGDAVGPRWSVSWPQDPVLLRRDAGSAWLMTPEVDGGVRVHRVSLADGAVIWSTPAWEDLTGGLVSGDPEILAGNPPRSISIPGLQRSVRHTQVVIAGDRQTLVLAERTGRVVALDAGLGTPLWRAAMPVTRIFDVDVADGTLVIAGEGPRAVGDRPGAGALVYVLCIVEARTGAIVTTRDLGANAARWVRLGRGGLLAVGRERFVEALNAATGRQLWRLDDRPVADTTDAFLDDDRLYIRRADRRLAMVDATTGRVLVPAMEDRGRLSITSPMRVFRPGGSGEAGGRSIGFATPAGYVAFDDTGAAVAVDALDATGEIVAAALGDAYAVTVQTRAMTAATANEPVFAMHALERASGRLVASTPLVLYGTVRRVEAIDGFVLVNAGEAIVAYRMPAGDAESR